MVLLQFGSLGLVARRGRDFLAGSGQALGVAGHLAQDLLQLVHKRVEPFGKFSDLVIGGDLHSLGQIAFTLGHILDALDHLLKANEDGARDFLRDNQKYGQTAKPENSRYRAAPAPSRIHVFYIDPGSDDPSPGLKALDKGEFPHWLVAAGFGPHVVDKIAVGRARCVDKIHEDGFSIRVFEVAEVLAIQFRSDGMHHHGGMHVIDPEIVGAVVAHSPNGLNGTLLSLLAADLSLLLQPVLLGDDGIRDFHEILRLFHPLAQ